jgi:hypothetical protein
MRETGCVAACALESMAHASRDSDLAETGEDQCAPSRAMVL